MSVTTKHPEYQLFQKKWVFARDVIAGNDAVKKKGTTYLPASFSADTARYNEYKNRTYLIGVTARTKTTLSGMVFRKPITYEGPDALLPLLDNFDGAGQTMQQAAKELFSEMAEAGRVVSLVNYTGTGKETAEDIQKNGLQPYVSSYTAESFINWKMGVSFGKSVLTLVVLEEDVQKAETIYGHETEKEYLVLRLENGIYTQQRFNEKGEAITKLFVPTAKGEAAWPFIPFFIAGSENNLPSCDEPPLYDLGLLAIAHYQTTSDHRDNLHYAGQMTMGVSTQMDYAQWQEATPNGFNVGARSVQFLGEGGSFTTASVPEVTGLSKDLEILESQMISLGAQLVQRKGQAETAEAARINAAGEASVLDNMADNLSAHLTMCCKAIAIYVGIPSEDIKVTVNKDFWESRLSGQDLAAVVAASQSGSFARTDALHMIREGRIELPAGRDDDAILEEAASDRLDATEFTTTISGAGGNNVTG